MIAGQLEIDLVMGIARLQRDSQEALGIVRNFGETSKRILEGIGAGFSVHEITEFAKNTVDAIAKMKDLAAEVGTSASAMSRFEAPTRMAGLSIDDTANAMFRMSKAALEARDPSTKAAQALQAIGISTSQLKGLKADEMFELVARQIAKYSDGIDKNNVMMTLFSKSGREMNRVVADIAETQKLAATVTDEQAAEAKKLNDQLIELKMSSEAFWRSLLSQGVPALNDILKAFMEARKEGGLFEGLVGGMSAAMDKVFGKTVQLQILETDRLIAEQVESMKNLANNAAVFGQTPSFAAVQAQTRALNELLQKRLGLQNELANSAFAGGAVGSEGKDLKFDPQAARKVSELAKEIENLRAKILGAAAAVDPHFLQDMSLLNIAMVSGKVSFEEYAQLVALFIQQQPGWKKATDEQVKAMEDLAKIDAQTVDEINKLMEASGQRVLQLQDEVDRQRLELTLLGATNAERAVELLDLQQKIALRGVVNEADRQGIVIKYEELKQLAVLHDSMQQEVTMWKSLGDATTTFFEDLFQHGTSAFHNLWAKVKEFFAQMAAMFATRWVLQLAASLTGSTALSAAAGQVGNGTLAGSLLSSGGLLGNFASGMGLSTSAVGAGAIGAGVGVEAGSAAGIGSYVGAALPVIGWVMAAYALWQAFKDKGENWQATLGFGGNANAYSTQGVFGAEGFQSIQGNDAVNRQIQAFMASSGGIDRMLAHGLTSQQIATITGNLGGSYTTRNDGQPAQFAFGPNDSTAPQQLTLEYLQHKYGIVFDTIDHTFADFIRNYTGDSQGLLTEIGNFAAVMSALQDSPVPGLNMESLRAMQREGEKLNDTFNRVTAGWSTYVSLFYSADEQHTLGMSALQHQLDQFNVTLPTTREGFRHLVETTEVGSPLWQALIGMAQAFSDLVPAADAATNSVSNTTNALGRGDNQIFGSSGSRYGMPGGTDAGSSSGGGSTGPSALESATQTLGQYASGLLSNSSLSALSPQDQLSAAERDWHDALMAAMGGDAGAMARLPGLSDHYLGVARSYYGSSSRYVDIFNQVSGGDRGVAGGDFQTTTINLQTQTNTTLTEIHGVLMEIRDRGGVGPEPVATVGLTEQARR